MDSTASKEPPKKRGRPSLRFEDLGYDGQYKAADSLVRQYQDSPGVIFRAATIAACRAKMQHSAYIYRKLEKEDSNAQALELRKAEKYFKTHPRKSPYTHSKVSVKKHQIVYVQTRVFPIVSQWLLLSASSITWKYSTVFYAVWMVIGGLLLLLL